jgi:hypothetical protein
MILTVVAAIGYALEAIGLGIAATGILKTWRAFSSDGDRFFGRQIAVLGQAWERTKRIVRRLLRRPGTTQAIFPLSVKVKVTAHAPLLWSTDAAELPSIVTAPMAFAAEVEARMKRLNDHLYDLAESAKAETEKREAAEAHLRDDLNSHVARLEMLSRYVAIGGLEQQFIGWFFVALGLGCQMIAGLLM